MTAADGALGRLVADDKAVAGDRADRLVEHQLHARRAACGNLIGAENGDASGYIVGAQMHMHRRPVAQRAHFGGKHEQVGIDLTYRPQIGRRDQPIAAPHIRFVDAGEVDGAALSGRALAGFMVVGVDPAHPRRLSGTGKVHMGAHFNAAGKYRTGNHQSGAGDGKGAVDGEAEVAV